MTTPVFGRDEDVAAFIGDALSTVFAPPYTAIGFVDHLGRIGGAVFNGYNGANIEVTIFGPGLVDRKSILVVLRYVFHQLRCERLTARTRRDNHLMRKLLPRLGFTLEAVQRRFYGRSKADSAFLYVMDRDDAAKWIAHYERQQSTRIS